MNPFPLYINLGIYRLIAAVLFINNLLGIILNLELALASIYFFGLGIVGIAFLFVSAAWYLKPEEKNPVVPFSLISYNFVILFFAVTADGPAEPFSIYYPTVFPIINIILFSLMVAIYFLFRSRLDKENKWRGKRRTAIMLLLYLVIVLAALGFITLLF